jgi:hypothetical protein
MARTDQGVQGGCREERRTGQRGGARRVLGDRLCSRLRPYVVSRMRRRDEPDVERSTAFDLVTDLRDFEGMPARRSAAARSTNLHDGKETLSGSSRSSGMVRRGVELSRWRRGSSSTIQRSPSTRARGRRVDRRPARVCRRAGPQCPSGRTPTKSASSLCCRPPGTVEGQPGDKEGLPRMARASERHTLHGEKGTTSLPCRAWRSPTFRP